MISNSDVLDGIDGFLNKGNFRPVNHNSAQKQRLHVHRASQYFDEHPECWKTFSEFINGDEKARQGVSLRMLYFLCTKYCARKSGVFYEHDGETINLFDRFQTSMGTRRLKNMDVFQRRTRNQFTKHGISIKTTPAQQSFFEFAFRNGVIKYAKDHRNEIAQAMHDYEKQQTIYKLTRNIKRKIACNAIVSGTSSSIKRNKYITSGTDEEKDDHYADNDVNNNDNNNNNNVIHKPAVRRRKKKMNAISQVTSENETIRF